MNKEVILTGLRSNSSFHLGNYLGAIQPIINLQTNLSGKYQVNMFIPDLHSFTTPIDHSALYQQTIDNLKLYVAAGLNIEDPDTYIYRQSYISAHSELTWILSCFTYFGELRRMTQFKDKSGLSESDELFGDQANVSAGLFIYPVLMAADILLYDAKWVPVGEDQRQHLELTRDLAIRFNNKFEGIFTVPEDWKHQLEFMLRDSGSRIRSLKNPDKKMSKSVNDPAGTINLSDDPELAAKKVMSATTDSIGSINLDWEKQPGISNLLQILALLKNKSIDGVATEWQGQSNYGDLKQVVADQVKTFLTDLQNKLKNVDESLIISKLNNDEQKIREIANSKLLKVQKAVGLRS
jgi:tryptophanyl-tRNA synthetase